MAREAKKRIGRPPRNPPTRGKRVSLGLKVTAEVKRHLDSAFRTSGRTQSQEAEHLIEKALAYDQMLDAIHTTFAAFPRSGRARLQDEHYAERVLAIWEKALANDQMLDATLSSIAPRKSGCTRLQDEHYAERLPATAEEALANDQMLDATLSSIAPRKSGCTRLQDEHYAERVLAIAEEIEGGSVEAALRRRNWRRDGTTGHWIPPEVHRLPPDGFIEQSAAERRDK
jgi:hypothetical protein